MNDFWDYLLSYKVNKKILDKVDEVIDDEMEEKEKYRIKNLKGYSLIYNPIGEDLVIQSDKHTIYVQGKPIIRAKNFTEVIAMNYVNIDSDWFNIAIVPLVKKSIGIKYL